MNKHMNRNRAESVRKAYDLLAEEYASHLFHELDRKPFDRKLLDRFVARLPEEGDVWDLGCGPGHVTRYLKEAGAQVFGLDLSPQMVAEARKRSPDISFREGNMLELGLENNSVAGIVAFYAIVNLGREALPKAFTEMYRILKPGGALLVSFHIGDETLRPAELWGKKISMEFFLFPVPFVRQALQAAGLSIEEVLEREPYDPEVEYQSRRAYILARKPDSAST